MVIEYCGATCICDADSGHQVVTEYCGATCICDADSGHQVVTEYCGATCICDVVGSALLLSGVVHFYPHL